MATATEGTPSRAVFLTREQAGWAELQECLSGLTCDMYLIPGACGEWTVKDVLAHLAAWLDDSVRVVPLLLAGERVPRTLINQFNDEQYQAHRDITLESVQAWLEKSRSEFLAVLAQVPEDRLFKPGRLHTRAVANTYGHYRQHVRLLRRWQAGIKE